MADDKPDDPEEAARKAQAAQLREQIEHLATPQEKTVEKPGGTGTPTPESPRDFVHRRMREIEKEKSKPQ